MNCTILIPAYNVASYIEQAINSVFEQTYKEWDLLIVDDDSTDGTASVVESYLKPGRAISLLQLPHKGPANATHVGILNAIGPVVTVLDGDDALMPKALEIVMPIFRDTKRNIGFVWTKFMCSNGKQGWSGPLPAGSSLFEALTKQGWWRASHQRFLRKSCYVKSKHQLDPNIPFPSDLALALVMGYTNCSTFWIPHVTYWYRVGRKGSISQARRKEQRANASRLVKIARE